MPAQIESTLSRSVLLPGLTVERASRAAVTTTEADSHCWSEVSAEQVSCGKLQGRAGSSGLKPTTWEWRGIGNFTEYKSNLYKSFQAKFCQHRMALSRRLRCACPLFPPLPACCFGDEAEGEERDNNCRSKLCSIFPQQVDEVPPGFQLGPVSTLGLHVLDGEWPHQQVDPLGVPEDFWVQCEAVHEVLPGSEGSSQDVLLGELEGALNNSHHGVDGGCPRVQVSTHQPHKNLPALKHCDLAELLIFQHGLESWHELIRNEVESLFREKFFRWTFLVILLLQGQGEAGGDLKGNFTLTRYSRERDCSAHLLKYFLVF